MNSTPRALVEKWSPVLNSEAATKIADKHKLSVTAQLLENTERMIREERGMLSEAPNTVGALSGSGGALSGGGLAGTPETGGLAGFDPILIGLVRRAMPNLMAYDICGVQPMSGPTGLIFAMKSHYQEEGSTLRGGPEALYNEPDANFSASSAGPGAYDINYANNTGENIHPLGTVNPSNADANPGLLNDATGGGVTYTNYEGASSPGTGVRGIGRDVAETLGDPNGSALFNEMSFSIEKTSVFAKTRALKAEYTLELAQDLRAIHGLDAEGELANLLSSEILAEINREIVRTVYTVAKPGAQNNVANRGVFDLDVDSNGRWSVEKWKGLMFQMERDANAIAQQTRRGKGNFMITSADVASAMAMAGVLDYSSGITGAGGPSIGDVDDTGNLMVGTMNGRIKVFIDPYSANVADTHYYVMGYKGTSPYDAGLFYCPYVPLQQLRSIDPNTFQPKIAFKTRYGMVSNPFVEKSAGVPDQDDLTAGVNQYYRRVRITNLM
jgi:hypothetical protein